MHVEPARVEPVQAVEPPAPQAAPVEPAQPVAEAPAPAAPEPAPARIAPREDIGRVITQADPNAPKKGGWWQRAKASITGN